MKSPARTATPRHPHPAGLTLVEVLIATVIFAGVIAIVATLLTSSSRLHSKTVRRVENTADSRQALDLVTAELRQAGADPSNPPVGIVGIVAADSVTLHIRADLNGDGAIGTTEPSEDVTYRYDRATRTLTRNPGSGAATLLANVSSMTFSYFDAANQPLAALPLSASDAAFVHSIGISVTTTDRDSLPLNLTTRVTLRNQ